VGVNKVEGGGGIFRIKLHVNDVMRKRDQKNLKYGKKGDFQTWANTYGKKK